jgi:hypothetical protein
MRAVAAALVHHPVLDRQNAIVTSAITNLDLHDIARSAKTYGLSHYFVTHPIAAQRELAERIKSHWTSGSGARRIPDRTPAMELLHVVESLDAAITRLGGAEVEIWTTSARASQLEMLDYDAARQRLRAPGGPVLIVFGTGWGLAEEVYARARAQLSPIAAVAADGYNHLSVRAAAAITFDRLLGHR